MDQQYVDKVRKLVDESSKAQEGMEATIYAMLSNKDILHAVLKQIPEGWQYAEGDWGDHPQLWDIAYAWLFEELSEEPTPNLKVMTQESGIRYQAVAVLYECALDSEGDLIEATPMRYSATVGVGGHAKVKDAEDQFERMAHQ